MTTRRRLAASALCAAILALGSAAFGAPPEPNEAYVIRDDLVLWQDQPSGILKKAGTLRIGDKVALQGRTAKRKQGGEELDLADVIASGGARGWVLAACVVPGAVLAAVLPDEAQIFSDPNSAAPTDRFISGLTVTALVQQESRDGFASIRCYDIAQDSLFAAPTFVAMKDLVLGPEEVDAALQYSMAAGSRDLTTRREILKTIFAEHGRSVFLPMILAKLGGIAKPSQGAWGTYVVSADKVDVRISPDEKNGRVVSQLNSGRQVEVLEATLDDYTVDDATARWYRIKLPAGWVFGAPLKPLEQ
jgi:hypothetical protein